MIKPLKMAILLLSVHPLLNQCLLHLHPTYMTDLPTYLPPSQLVIVLLFSSERLSSTLQVYRRRDIHLLQVISLRGYEGQAPWVVSLVTDEPAFLRFLCNW